MTLVKQYSGHERVKILDLLDAPIEMFNPLAPGGFLQEMSTPVILLEMALEH